MPSATTAYTGRETGAPRPLRFHALYLKSCPEFLRNTAADIIDQTDVRARAMERRLRDVEQLPPRDTANALGLANAGLPEGVDPDNATQYGRK